MAFQSKVGTFVKSTGGAPVSQAVTGVGFAPKALILWGAGLQTADTAVSDQIRGVIGFSTRRGGSTQQFSASIGIDDNAATSNCSRRCAAKAYTQVIEGEVLRFECDLTSFDSDGFTLNWTTNNNTPYIICYLALGGTDLTDANVVTWNTATSTGVQTVTGAGFQPDIVFHLGAIASTTLPSSSAGASLLFGAMTSANQWSQAVFSADNSANMDAQHIQSDANCIVGTNASQATAESAAFISMDSDGFSVNWGAIVGARAAGSLLLKGGRHKLGNFAKSTGGAPASQAVTGVGFPGKALMLSSTASVNSGGTVAAADSRFGLGAASAAGTEVGTSFIDPDTLATSDLEIYTSGQKCAVWAVTAGTEFLADLTSFDTDGFTLNWTTNNATAARMYYWAAGDAPLSLSRTGTDTVGLSESLARSASATRALTESVGASESLARSTTRSRPLTESVSLGESLARTSAGSRSTAESVAMADVATRVRFGVRAVTEAVALADVPSRTTAVAVGVADAIAIADVATQVKSFARQLADTLSLADIAGAVRAYQRSVTESLSLADSPSRLRTSSRSVADVIGLAESLARTVAESRSTTDTITATDGVTRSTARSRATTDSLSLSESLGRSAAKARTADDVLIIVDSVTTSATGAVSGIDQIDLDDVAGRVVALAPRQVADSVSVVDVASRTASRARDVGDALATTDVATRSASASRSASDSLGTSESVQRVVAMLRSISETVGLADTATRAVSGSRAVVDLISGAEIITWTPTLTRSVAESVGLSDAASRSPMGLTRGAGDSVGLAEALSRMTTATRSVGEVLVVSDAVLPSGVVVVAFIRFDASSDSVLILESRSESSLGIETEVPRG